MKRKYFINGWEETREYFLRFLGRYTAEELQMFADGKTVYREDNAFRIENYYGI